MCGEAAAITGVFGILDDQAFVLGDLEAPDSSHQLGAVRVTRAGEARGKGGSPPPPSGGHPKPHPFAKAYPQLF